MRSRPTRTICSLAFCCLAAAVSLPAEPPTTETVALSDATSQPAAADQDARQVDETEVALAAVREAIACGAFARAERLLRPLLRDHPAALPIRLAWIDAAIAREQWATARNRLRETEKHVGRDPEIDFRAARVLLALDGPLGAAALRHFPTARAGDVVDGWLLVRRHETGRFLCCREEAALFRLRRAFDSGLDTPRAHLLHAALWRQLDDPDTAWALVRAREHELCALQDPDALAEMARIAFAAGDVRHYLRYTRAQADLLPTAQRARLLADAYRRAADAFAIRGDAELHAAFLERAARLTGTPGPSAPENTAE